MPMPKLFTAIALTAGSLVFASAQAAPIAPSGIMAPLESLGGAEAVHCTPGKRHHIPTWNYRTDGCRRPARKKGSTQKAPPAKAKSSNLQR